MPRVTVVSLAACCFCMAVAHAQSAPAAAAPQITADPGAPQAEPFAWGDFTWLNGTSRQKRRLIDSPIFTGQVDVDVNYTYSFHHPNDDTVVGSTALARNNEFELSFLAIGGDFHYDNVRGRVLTQFGTRATVIPRNDGSVMRGQFDLADAYRYVSEAYTGYHFSVLYGLNIDAGMFMSYIGQFSYDNWENWAYQPSYTSDNTPWFFNGARVQLFVTDRLKFELWVINGWQSYGKFNAWPGLGYQAMWRPQEAVAFVTNGYVGTDTPNQARRVRFHSDNSVQIRYYNHADSTLNRAALTATFDVGFENGGGVTAFNTDGGHAQNFLSGMLYHRAWFLNDHVGWTVGGGIMHNPGRYLVLAPTGAADPSNGQFVMAPGAPFDAWDISTTLDWMPADWATWRLEWVYRDASVPYFAGPRGVTSPSGYGASPPGFVADLVRSETRLIAAWMARF